MRWTLLLVDDFVARKLLPLDCLSDDLTFFVRLPRRHWLVQVALMLASLWKVQSLLSVQLMAGQSSRWHYLFRALSQFLLSGRCSLTLLRTPGCLHVCLLSTLEELCIVFCDQGLRGSLGLPSLHLIRGLLRGA